MRYKAAILDFDGTLMDSMPVWKHVGEDYLRLQGITPPDNLREVLKEMSLGQSTEYLRVTYHLPFTRAQIVDQIAAMVDHQFRHEVPLKPYARQFLERGHQAGMRFCIATASDRRVVEATLHRLGVDTYIDDIVTCIEVGHGKNEPHIFEEALIRLGVAKHECLVFEDALHAIRTAVDAGFTTIGVYDASASEDEQEISDTASDYIRSFAEWDINTLLGQCKPL